MRAQDRGRPRGAPIYIDGRPGQSEGREYPFVSSRYAAASPSGAVARPAGETGQPDWSEMREGRSQLARTAGVRVPRAAASLYLRV
jgi:hypothetical protein